MIYVRFTPNSGHSEGSRKESACDPKRKNAGTLSCRTDPTEIERVRRASLVSQMRCRLVAQGPPGADQAHGQGDGEANPGSQRHDAR